MPRALFVSYTFPPTGGAGVQRLTKWLKYLPRHGWDASVLTVDNPSVPLRDASLGSDVPAAMRVVRARTLEPSYPLKMTLAGVPDNPARSSRWQGAVKKAAGVLLQPDPQVLWAPGAVRAGKKLLADVVHDVIVATGPPFSSFVVGARLAATARLPLVLDFRDEWDLSSRYWEHRPKDFVSRFVQGRVQSHLLRRARLVLATTERSAAALAEKCRMLRSASRAACIYNGFDEDDFDAIVPERKATDRFRLAYVGTLWALTDARPLIEGLRLLANRSPHLAAGLEVVFAGRRTDAQSALLDGAKGLASKVTLLDYVDHTRAVEIMRTSDALCLLLSDVPGAERVVPAKIFEYMAARRPILALAPTGEARELLVGHPAAFCCQPSDPTAIALSIESLADGNRAGDRAGWREWNPGRFSRDRLTQQLVEALEECHA